MKTLGSLFILFTLMSFVAAGCKDAPAEIDPVDSTIQQTNLFAAAQSMLDMLSTAIQDVHLVVCNH